MPGQPDPSRAAERRDRILAAAMALADERGLDAVTMRAVAERVGLTSMALYPYVGGKRALLDALAERLVAELPVPPARSAWPDRLRALARGLRGTALRHPALVPLLLGRAAAGAEGARITEALYAVLLDAGVPPLQVPRVERLLSAFVLGFVASEVGGRFGATDPDRYLLPAHRALAHHLDAPVDFDAEFEADLDGLTALVRGLVKPG